MDISVVIPTFNRKHLIEKTLPEFINQRVDRYAYEVIFIVNGSSDGSEAVLREASSKQPDRIRYFSIQPSGSPAAPRNLGIRESKGSVIIILDDDVVPDPDLVYQHAEFHREHPEPHHAAIGEVYVPPELSDDPVSFFPAMITFDQFRGRDRLSYLDFWTCNVSVKRQFMLDHGMFDESLPYFEDVYCGYRLASQGMHLHFVPGARGRHVHQLQLKDVPAKGRFIGRGLYAFEQRVPEREVRERHGILSWDLRTGVLLRRLLNRAGLFAIGNPVSMSGLKPLVRASSKRNRITDLYYYTLFRRNILAGYREAKRQARQLGRAGRSLLSAAQDD